MEDNLENEYIVTDENGCATDPTIFGEWEQNPETQALMASFNAFKFPSSDNIRFQCNIRVCFGRCQPVSISMQHWSDLLDVYQVIMVIFDHYFRSIAEGTTHLVVADEMLILKLMTRL